MKKVSIPWYDELHLKCRKDEDPFFFDMELEKLHTGKLPKKYEEALIEYFGTSDKKEMLKKAMKSRYIPVYTDCKTVELIDTKTGKSKRRMANRRIYARVSDVVKRIQRSRLPARQKQLLLDRVKDISNEYASKLYPNNIRKKDFDGEVCITNKRCCDVDWTGHGAYRSELRDRKPSQVNEEACQFIFNRHFNPDIKKKKPPKKDVVRFKGKGGPIVMEYDAKQKPIDVDIITTYPSNRLSKELLKIAKLLEKK